MLWVVDAEGNNLLDPATEGNILDRPVKAMYNGRTYLMNGERDGEKTRVNLSQWAGLFVSPFPSEDKPPVLWFGEFEGATTHKGVTFTIDWADGTTTDVKFDHIVEWVPWSPEVDDHYTEEEHPNNIPIVTNALWIDGEFVSDDHLLTARIVK